MKEITKINALHKINKNSDHYAAVKAYMIENGAPTIRVCDNGNGVYAIEGCHRISVAHELGIMPIFEEIDADMLVKDLDLDFDTYGDDDMTVADMIEKSQQIIFDFEEIYYGE